MDFRKGCFVSVILDPSRDKPAGEVRAIRELRVEVGRPLDPFDLLGAQIDGDSYAMSHDLKSGVDAVNMVA